LAWRSLVPLCIHASCWWLTARWHYPSTISPPYNISSSGVELYSGSFSSWYTEQYWTLTYQQLPIKFSLKRPCAPAPSYWLISLLVLLFIIAPPLFYLLDHTNAGFPLVSSDDTLTGIRRTLITV
jgi:hypothetical protein